MDTLTDLIDALPWVKAVLEWGIIPYVLAVSLSVVVFYYVGRLCYRIYQVVRNGVFLPVYSSEGRKEEWRMRFDNLKRLPGMVLLPPDEMRLHAFNNPWSQIDATLIGDPSLVAQWARRYQDKFQCLLEDSDCKLSLHCDICGGSTSRTVLDAASEESLAASAGSLLSRVESRTLLLPIANELLKRLARSARQEIEEKVAARVGQHTTPEQVNSLVVEVIAHMLDDEDAANPASGQGSA